MSYYRVDSSVIDEHFLVMTSALLRCTGFYIFADQNIDFDDSPLILVQCKQMCIVFEELLIHYVFLKTPS